VIASTSTLASKSVALAFAFALAFASLDRSIVPHYTPDFDFDLQSKVKEIKVTKYKNAQETSEVADILDTDSMALSLPSEPINTENWATDHRRQR